MHGFVWKTKNVGLNWLRYVFVRPAVPTPTMAKDSGTPEEAQRRGGSFANLPAAD